MKNNYPVKYPVIGIYDESNNLSEIFNDITTLNESNHKKNIILNIKKIIVQGGTYNVKIY